MANGKHVLNTGRQKQREEDSRDRTNTHWTDLVVFEYTRRPIEQKRRWLGLLLSDGRFLELNEDFLRELLHTILSHEYDCRWAERWFQNQLRKAIKLIIAI